MSTRLVVGVTLGLLALTGTGVAVAMWHRRKNADADTASPDGSDEPSKDVSQAVVTPRTGHEATAVSHTSSDNGFEDELKAARQLQQRGLRRLAALIAGVMLERALKKLCHVLGIPLTEPHGAGHEKTRSASRLNAELRNNGTYGRAFHMQIEAWLTMRNDAAHDFLGPFEHDLATVAIMIDGVERFVDANAGRNGT